MWKYLVLGLLGLTCVASADSGVSVLSDVSVTVQTDQGSSEKYLKVLLPEVSLPQNTEVAYAEVSFSTALPEGTSLEIWDLSSTESLPWASRSSDLVPLARVTTMSKGSVRLNVTNLARLWKTNVGREFLVRIPPGQGSSFSEEGSLSNVKLSYHGVPR